MRGAVIALAFALAATPLAARAQTPADLAGFYDGSQMEMAAGLELHANGKFRFGLSYGALDELAEGDWTADSGHVYLTTKPKVRPPAFVVERDTPEPPGVLKVSISNGDIFGGLPITVIVTFAGEDRPRYIEVEEDGSVPVPEGAQPVSIIPDLPVYEMPYNPVALDPARGHALVFRFDVNDLGKADFRRQPLIIENGSLLLERHGRTIRFDRD